ncbi:MAG: pyridoxal-phosphate dependent enzyme, partial [Rhodospirillales bacterium]
MPISHLPRVTLAHAPTPLEVMSNLSTMLDGPNLYVKRDDCTGLAMGGNKTRQLEYYFGEALQQSADTVIITGAVQSNFVRQAAAAARKLGMDCEIQLEHRVAIKGLDYETSGNVLLDR